MKPWLVITITGTTAGAVVGALTYTAAVHSADAMAVTTGLGINALGTVGSYLASATLGDMAGVSVKVASRVAGHLTEETIKSSGRTAAAVMAAATGALTTLSFTAGSHIIKYSVEYGGIISQEIAKKIAEEYFKYKMKQTGFDEGVDTGWVIVETEEEEPSFQEKSQILEDSVTKSTLSTVSDIQESI